MFELADVYCRCFTNSHTDRKGTLIIYNNVHKFGHNSILNQVTPIFYFGNWIHYNSYTTYLIFKKNVGRNRKLKQHIYEKYVFLGTFRDISI